MKSAKTVNKAVGAIWAVWAIWYLIFPYSKSSFPEHNWPLFKLFKKRARHTRSLQNKKRIICWPTKGRRRVCRKKKHRVNINTFSSAAAPLLKSSYIELGKSKSKVEKSRWYLLCLGFSQFLGSQENDRKITWKSINFIYGNPLVFPSLKKSRKDDGFIITLSQKSTIPGVLTLLLSSDGIVWQNFSRDAYKWDRG